MLDLQLAQILEKAKEDGVPDFSDLAPPEARQVLDAIQHQVQQPHALSRTRDVVAETPTGPVPIRLYFPFGAAGGGLPVTLFFHGGGFVLGDVNAFDGVAGQLAEKAGCIVAAVDYRLAPENPFPCAVQDSIGALQWVAKNALDIGGDPARIAVVGESAGGNLAAICALYARSREKLSLRCQVLVYPATASDSTQFSSYHEYGEGYLLTARAMNYFRTHYMNNGNEGPDWWIAPLDAKDFSGLPPTLMILAKYDPLHDEGLRYAECLQRANVQVIVSEYLGMTHAFFTMTAVLEAARQAVDQVAGMLSRSLR